jgi:N4-gp56 family major capsid protein
MTKITIQETLLSGSDLTGNFAPYLLYSEVLEGARRPLAFLQIVKEDFSLIGKDGYTIKFMTATPLVAESSTEAEMSNATYTAAHAKTIGMVPLTVPKVIHSSVEFTDILMEDYPSIDWVRLKLRNMGAAVMEFLDALVYSIIAAGSTTKTTAASLTYGVVMDTLAEMENLNWIADDVNAPFLILSPIEASYLMQDTAFVDARRYTTAQLSRIVEGEAGMFAGCRVLKTPYLKDSSYVFIVFPSDGSNGPVVILAWKRRLTVKNERYESKAYTYYITSIRANAAVVQADGVSRITISATP